VQPDQAVPTVPNDPLFPQQLSLQTDWPLAWSTATGTRSTVIAVVDSGIDHTHPDLIDNLWVNQMELPFWLRVTGDVDGDGFVTLADANSPGGMAIFAGFGVVDTNGDGRIDGPELLGGLANGIDDDGNGFIDDLIGYSMTNIPASGEIPNPDPMDCVGRCPAQGHGTAVAGILGAAGNNAMGVCGTNWRPRIMALRVEDRTTGFFNTWAISQAMVYAAGQGARIANNSFSLYTSTPPLAWFGPNGAYQFADGRGMMIACSAGNTGLDNDVNPHWPGNFNTLLGGVVQVAAHNASFQLARMPADLFNSSFGVNTVNLAAHGTASRVYSTRVSWQATSPGLQPNLWAISYGAFYGTSSATPHVAGLGSLVLALNLGLVGPAVRRYILAGAMLADFPAGLPVQGGRALFAGGTLMLAQQALGARSIVTTLGSNPNVTADARIFDAQFNAQGSFFPFGVPVSGGVEVDAGDLDGDGVDELLFLTNSGWSPLELFVTDNNGGLKAQQSFPADSTLAAGDVDFDRVDEIVVGRPETTGPLGTQIARAEIYEITPGPGFPLTLAATCYAGVPVWATALDVAVADVNGDGSGEIITIPAVGTGDTARVYDRGGTLRTSFGSYAGNATHGLRPRVAGGDLDSDGIDEILIGQAHPTLEVVPRLRPRK